MVVDTRQHLDSVEVVVYPYGDTSMPAFLDALRSLSETPSRYRRVTNV